MVETLDKGNEGYMVLRAKALEVFNSNSHVRDLCDDYGGWDKSGILEIPMNQPRSQHDLAFWIGLLLYGHTMGSKLHELGLGLTMKILEHTLILLNWSDEDIRTIVWGHSFKEFARRYLNRDDEYWNYVHPFSTGGWAGWLDLNTIDKYIKMITENEARVSALQPLNVMDFSIDDSQESYQSVKRMLLSAKHNNSDLCIIVSG